MTFLSKKLVVRKISPKKISKSNSIQKDLKKLEKIYHKYIEKEEQIISKKNHQQFNLEIKQINSKYEIQINKITEIY